jgi:hypothetical protein
LQPEFTLKVITALSNNAELLALLSGICLATLVPGSQLICVFTDSLLSAESIVNPVLKSGQAHAIAACWMLIDWLEVDPLQEISFIHVRARLLWGIQAKVHRLANSQRARQLMPDNPQVSLNFARKWITDLYKDVWKTSFLTAAYRSSSFLDFNGSNGKPLTLSYSDGSTWLQHLDNTWLCAQVVHGILDHAPHREYQMCFHIEGDLYYSYC